MRVVILHAYSRNNLGDGLLVDEAMRIVKDAYGQVAATVVAIDASSFRDLSSVVEWSTDRGSRLSAIARGSTALARRPALEEDESRLATEVRQADVVVGVGGGYLRAPLGAAAVRFLGAHVPQLALAGAASAPSVYLPQSIGPFGSPLASPITRMLRRITRIYARDDRTLDELCALPNVSRMPDMAVLALAAESPAPIENPDAPPVLVLRGLPRGRTYVRRLRSLVAALGNPIYGVQSRGRGNEDRLFVHYLAGEQTRPLVLSLPDVLRDFPGATVISVRLHGALAAIRAGSPAIHLGYERKGWGAYSDMGLPAFVHPARSFDPACVAAQARALSSDAAEFWAPLGERRSMLSAQRDELVDALRSVA